MTDQIPPDEVQIPREQLPIPFFGRAVLAARRQDGQIYLSIRDMCEAMDLAFSAQRRRIVSTERLRAAMVQFRVRTPGGRQVQDFLELEMVPIWLLGIQLRRVSEEVRQKLGHVQEYLIASVQAAFAQLTGLPDTPSREIEDLSDLDRIDVAFQQLSELAGRQSTIEQSQDRARLAWRELTDRVRTLTDRVQQLEQTVSMRLSPAQPNTIYRLVQAWGTAKAARDPKLTTGAAIRACWAIVNARCGVTTYTDIPASRYVDSVAYIQDAYFTLTGERLTAVEQDELGL